MARPTFSVPPDALVPQTAELELSSGILTVTFSAPLTPGPLADVNWTVLYHGDQYQASGATASSNRVNALMTPLLPAPGGPSVSYAASPPDVTRLSDGLPAAPFASHPLTVI